MPDFKVHFVVDRSESQKAQEAEVAAYKKIAKEADIAAKQVAKSDRDAATRPD